MAEQEEKVDLDASRLLWRHKGIVALGVMAGTVLGLLFYARAVPIYQTSAQVLVVNKSAETLPVSPVESRAAFVPNEDYLTTHLSLICSPAIISQAVKDDKLGQLKSFAGHGDPTSEIIGSLKSS